MRKSRIILIVIAAILLVSVMVGAVVVYSMNSRNAARPEAIAALESDETVLVSQVDGEDWLVFRPADPSPTTGLIFYPGGFVDPAAYAPVAREIASRGYLVVIDPMPLNLAVLGAEGAGAIITDFPEISAWAIGGHSLGGAMAAEYVSNNPGQVDGLALWAAYPAGNTDLSAEDIDAVSVYGDGDGVAAVSDVLDGAMRLPAGTVLVVIPGGNHTQFGRYGQGLQRGDNPAGITPEEQQRIVVDSTVQMLDKLND